MAKPSHRRKRVEEPIVWRVFQRRGTVQILLLLEDQGELRFSEVDRELATINRQTLVSRLVELREVGMINREVDLGPPLATRYSLTSAGRHLAQAAEVLDQVSRRADLPALAA
jgi:DNA-binding HxlR family transcriptional regulator